MPNLAKEAYARIATELGAPRERRPIGSGWVSGAIAIIAGLASLLMVVALRYPHLLLMPELSPIRDSAAFRIAVYAILASGYLLAITSLILRRDATLGTCAMALTLLATMIGSLPPPKEEVAIQGVFFGLDFFVLNILFLGFLFVPLERLLPKAPDQTVLRDEWREDVFYYLISSMFVQVLTYLTLAPSTAIKATGWLQPIQDVASSLPWAVQIVAIMLLTDFVQYWVHRTFHTVPFLWKFHAVHHSAQHMDWIAGARMHFLEIIVLRALTATPMFAIGFDESAIQTYILIVYVYSSFIHSNVGINFRGLEKLVVVPRFHHWHHGIEREAIDVNFAIHFPFLDKAFGTHHMPANRWPEGYGIVGHPVPKGYIAQFLYPFRRKKAPDAASTERTDQTSSNG